MGKVGRPKAEIARKKRLDLRVTDFEFKKIERAAKEKNLSKTDAILQGIDLLIAHKPKRYRKILNSPKNSSGVEEGEIIFYKQKK